MWLMVSLKDVTHNTVLPADIVEELEKSPTLNVMCVEADLKI